MKQLLELDDLKCQNCGRTLTIYPIYSNDGITSEDLLLFVNLGDTEIIAKKKFLVLNVNVVIL